MAYALVTNAAARFTSASSGCTTAGVDTTGSSLIVLGTCRASGGTGFTVSDNKSNTWTAMTTSGTDPLGRMYYCINPTVGTGHTWTLSGTNCYANIFVAAFSYDATPAFDQEAVHFGTAGSTSDQPGSLTAAANNALLVTLVAGEAITTAYTIDSSFSITNQQLMVLNQCYAGGLAYLVQPTASATNPTWTWATNQNGTRRPSTFQMTFIASGGGGATVKPLAALGVG